MWTDMTAASTMKHVMLTNGGMAMVGVTENPAINNGIAPVEDWNIYNFTVDAHPIHLHLVRFQVINRTPIPGIVPAPVPFPQQAWETGFKDTVIAYPGEITTVRAKFDIAGLYVWHCHIVEHEDNEMMRPYVVSATASLSGTVTSGGLPLAGVTVNLAGTAAAATITDAAGNYTFAGLDSGSYTVTPTLAGYAFAPLNTAVMMAGTNVAAINFTGTNAGVTYSISGTVAAGALPLSGVTMTLAGPSSGTTTTDVLGNYTFAGLANGAYTVTPSVAGSTFLPLSTNVTVAGANVTLVNFAPNPYTVTANAAGSGAGTISSSPGAISYAYPALLTGTSTAISHGTSVVLTATATTGSIAA
jgi:hypothetical protein